jgi:hypothetical protein
LYRNVEEITAAIRHHRSTAGFGFNTRVRIEGLTLSRNRWERQWPMIERDVLDGNNIESADVSFSGDSANYQMTLVPVAGSDSPQTA